MADAKRRAGSASCVGEAANTRAANEDKEAHNLAVNEKAAKEKTANEKVANEQAAIKKAARKKAAYEDKAAEGPEGPPKAPDAVRPISFLSSYTSILGDI